MSSNLTGLLTGLNATLDPAAIEGGLDKAQRMKAIGLAKQIIAEASDPVDAAMEMVLTFPKVGAIRLLLEWEAFDHIPDSGSITYTDLAAKVNAEVTLVRRLCWTLVAQGVLVQPSPNTVAHGKTSPVFKTSSIHCLFFKGLVDRAMRPFTTWPAYFEAYGRAEPAHPTPSPVGFAHGAPDKGLWDLLQGKALTEFNMQMEFGDKMMPTVGIFPYAELVRETAEAVPAEAPLVIDVGGGRGATLVGIMSESGIAAERCVLQDLENVVAEAKKLDVPELRGVRMMGHDFFTEQPVKEALVYHMRRILHDWPDAYATKILAHLAAAMAPYSRILIAEQVVADPPDAVTAAMDLMMLNLAAKERTMENWEMVLKGAGLEIRKVWRKEGTALAVIECVKAGKE